MHDDLVLAAKKAWEYQRQLRSYADKLRLIEHCANEARLCLSPERDEPNLDMARRRIAQIREYALI